MLERMWKNEERKTAPGVIRIFDRRYPLWMRSLGAAWEPIRHFLSPRALHSALLVRGSLPKLCIFIAPKHQPYPHHQVQKCAKICLNCIQSPSITNSQMFYMETDRWSEDDDFSKECIYLFLWLRELSHFPSSMLRHYLQITDNTWWGNFSINFCTLRLCYRRWDVWVSRKWSGKIFSPLSDGAPCVSCGELSVSQITAWSLAVKHFFRIFQRILDDVKPNSLMGNWGLGENESLHLSRHNWLARPHNSFRLHSLTVIRIYKIVFSGFLWRCASKTNHHLATHWAHPTRYCCFSYHHGVRGKQRNHIFNSGVISTWSELEMDTGSS